MSSECVYMVVMSVWVYVPIRAQLTTTAVQQGITAACLLHSNLSSFLRTLENKLGIREFIQLTTPPEKIELELTCYNPHYITNTHTHIIIQANTHILYYLFSGSGNKKRRA